MTAKKQPKELGDNPTLMEILESFSPKQIDVLSAKVQETLVMATLDPRQKAVFEYLVQKASTGDSIVKVDIRWNDVPWDR